jgi:hypothetical protein
MVRPYHIHVLITLTNNHDMTKIGKNLVVQLITLLKELIAQLFFSFFGETYQCYYQ